MSPTTSVTPRLRTDRYGRINQHRVRIFKDPYSYPSWIVYLGQHWVGNAHSLTVAHIAGRVLRTNRLIYLNNPSCQELLIPMVTHGVAVAGHHEHWTPAEYGKHHDGEPLEEPRFAAGGRITPDSVATPHFIVHRDGALQQLVDIAPPRTNALKTWAEKTPEERYEWPLPR